jgi:hypothetical protein
LHHQLSPRNSILTLLKHFFASAAIMVQKIWTTLVPPTGEAIATGRSPAADGR